MPPPNAKLSIQWRPTADAIPAPLWRSCFPPNLEGQWWFSSLDRSNLQSQFEFLYGLLELNGAPVGIVAINLMDLPLDLVAPPPFDKIFRALGNVWRGARYVRTLFIGSPCSDEGAIGLLPGGLIPGLELTEIIPFLQTELKKLASTRKATIIVWKDFPSPPESDLGRILASSGLASMHSFPGMRMPLDFPDFEGYMKSLKPSRRANFRKKLKRSEALGPLEIQFIQNPPPETLAEILPLFMNTYEKGKTKFERLTPDFFRAIAEQPESHFILLRDPAQNNKLIAFTLNFLAGDRAIFKYLGIDYSVPEDRFLYFRLWEQTMIWALKCGAKEIQAGQTGYSAKLRLGLEPVPLYNWFQHKNPVIQAIFAKIAAKIDWTTLDEDLKEWTNPNPEPNAAARP